MNRNHLWTARTTFKGRSILSYILHSNCHNFLPYINKSNETKVHWNISRVIKNDIRSTAYTESFRNFPQEFRSSLWLDNPKSIFEINSRKVFERKYPF